MVATSVATLLSVCAPSQSAPVSFDQQVRPLFVKHCLACHGGVKQAGGLSLVWRDTALAGGDSGQVITPGDSEGSYLIERVVDPDEDYRMPPVEHGRRLNEEETAILRAWIEQGAPWQQPWSLRVPTPPSVPEATGSWPRAELDRFVQSRMENESLRPSAEADKGEWLRRVSFDLIGLPPQEAECHSFQAAEDKNAHEAEVDRLLASPHFGERWASVWLDLARYADTMGFEKDPPRDIWPYRDWVIQALNHDLPYDEFLVKQLAGDLMSDAGFDDRLATAFHRNTSTNVEGGTDDEEYRHLAVVDRVDTTWKAVLGVTIGCARCHDHPYDPITQEDYYRQYAVFNSTRDADLPEEWPKLSMPLDRSDQPLAERIDQETRLLNQETQQRVAETAGDLEQWQPLRFTEATSTRATKLVIRAAEPVAGLPAAETEIVTEGTVSNLSAYTLRAVAPVGSQAPAGNQAPLKVRAIRIDALPKDLAKAIKNPEMGFVVSRLELSVLRADGTEEEAFFADGYCDEPNPLLDPTDALRDNLDGWAVYTRLRQPRWAVFLLDEPIEFGPGDRITLAINHGKETDGQGALVLHRMRVSVSSSPSWAELLNDEPYRDSRERLALLKQQRTQIKSVAVPVFEERDEERRRSTYLLKRGDWLAPQQAVTPGAPIAFKPLDGDDRLAYARWIASGDNPLTARVFVNRVWAELFGTGLVPTLDDFGSTGVRPTHPELLDHLATRFQTDLGWSLKSLLRELVLSATYRQTARATANRIESDPNNQWLARGPRTRLTAEMVRDQALVLSGRINTERFGPPVMPYQPEGIWRSVYSTARWNNAQDESRFRRAIYTYWKRTAAYPSLVAFDQPARDVCTAQRASTNTPLQALVALNDPAFVELAAGLAERLLALETQSTEQRIAQGFRWATTEQATPENLTTLMRLHEQALAESSNERFAMTIVASALMNLDEALTK